MIRPDGFRGAAFGTTVDGDARADAASRRVVSGSLGITENWATVKQVHGAHAVEATVAGNLGEADAIFTGVPGLPVAVGVADCVPVIIEGPEAVAVVHAGWRGAVAGVVERALDALNDAGAPPIRAAIGPAIGPCCYEVGADVADRLPGHVSRTTWGTTSVDLPGFVAGQLVGLELWRSGDCTFTAPDLFSYRRDQTEDRQTAVAWLPAG
jgi:YfiH family protein